MSRGRPSNRSRTRTPDFPQRLLAWYERHGRKDLPWQRDTSSYKVWVSEIMLQQTRVETVVDYYQRFMERFPDVTTLADAPVDEVLHLWSGLGYYARARNLHKAARLIRDQHGGEFPDDFERVSELPGVGRSTAGAVLALAQGQRHPILDGNVKRVLARHGCIEGWPGRSAVARQLWELADRYTPDRRVAAYTQAIMDLGATLCTPRRPSCDQCPVARDCCARLTGRTNELPASKPKRTLPVRSTRMLVLMDDEGRVLLQKRPPAGIWGGLWSLPECDLEHSVDDWCRDTLGCRVQDVRQREAVRHSFSHFHLDIHPVSARVVEVFARIMEDADLVWYNCANPDRRGLAAPVKRLLESVAKDAKGARQ